jgi:Family of unknown function (DUF6807)
MPRRVLSRLLKVLACLLLAIAWRVAIGADGDRRRVVVAASADAVAVTIDGQPFTTLHAGKEARKPYLHPLLTASGKRVTRAFPMEQVVGESTDLPHQRGVWIGTERLSGIDFWENEPSYDRPNKGTIRFTSADHVESGADEGRFTMHADWLNSTGETVLVETRTMTARVKPDQQRVLDIDLSLTAKTLATFEDNHDAILGLRLATEFEEKHGGRAVNAEGLAGWERLRGARSAWVDWHATLDGESVGVAVMDAPTNFRFPTPWHVRDYALLFASPFASRDYHKEAPDGSLTLKPGETLRLRYRILVHPAHVDVAAAFKEFAQR